MAEPTLEYELDTRARHGERRGWHKRGLLLAMCGLCAMETVIAFPRPTVPEILPLPRFDTAHLDAMERDERKLALRGLDGHLTHALRAVGERVRRLGLRIYQNAPIEHAEHSALERDVRTLLAAGRKGELLELRALQSELFLRATKASLASGEPTLDLKELGGEFGHLLFGAWRDEDGGCVIQDRTLRLMFRSHFSRLTGLQQHPTFRQTLEELREYYATLLEFPPAPPHNPVAATQLRLSYARALSHADSSYDARPLQGILHFRLEQYGHASKLFEEYLEDQPNAPFSHLVQGHLQLARLRARSQHLGAP